MINPSLASLWMCTGVMTNTPFSSGFRACIVTLPGNDALSLDLWLCDRYHTSASLIQGVDVLNQVYHAASKGNGQILYSTLLHSNQKYLQQGYTTLMF
jgi:hypothetical protein